MKKAIILIGLVFFAVTGFSQAITVKSTISRGGSIEVVGNKLTVNPQSSAYTAQLSDSAAIVLMNSSANVNFSIPNNTTAAFSIGQQITVVQNNTGTITFAPASGVTINSAGASVQTRVQYSSATLIKVATNTWLLMGDLQ